MGDFGGGAYGVTPAAEGSYAGAEQSASSRLGYRVQSAGSLSAPVSEGYRAGVRVVLGYRAAIAISESGIVGTVVPGASYTSPSEVSASRLLGSLTAGGGRRGAAVSAGPRNGTAKFGGGVKGKSTTLSQSIGVGQRVRQGLHNGITVVRGSYHGNFSVVAGRSGGVSAGSSYRNDLLWEHPGASVRVWAAPAGPAEGSWTDAPAPADTKWTASLKPVPCGWAAPPDPGVRAWATPDPATGAWGEIPGVDAAWTGVRVLGLTDNG